MQALLGSSILRGYWIRY